MKKLIILLVILFSTNAWSATYYIDSAATGAADGTSWTDAYTTIQAALNARNLAAHTFYVSGGASGKTYVETLTMQYAGTVLAGSTEAGHSGQVRVDASSGAAAAINMNSKNNCTVNNIEFYGATGTNYGIQSTGSGQTFNSVMVTSNGRGVFANNTITFNRCLFTGNGNYTLYAQNSAAASITCNYCILTGTTNSIVSAFYYLTTLNNCVIYSNGAIPIDMATGTTQTMTIKNTIIYRADSGYIISIGATGPYPTTNNNVYYGGSATPFNNKGTGVNFADWKTASSQDGASFFADPLFYTVGSDFRLNGGSPAINSGANLSLTSDYAGNLVPKGSAPDIGAYESQRVGGLMSTFTRFNTFSPHRRLH